MKKLSILFAVMLMLVLGISQAFAAGPVSTTGNNFTMIGPGGGQTGGTNDVTITWDGALKTSVAATGQVANGTIASPCPFFDATWNAHDVAIYGPGTYSVNPCCPSTRPGCATICWSVADEFQEFAPLAKIVFTVGQGEIGGHMLFNWGANANIDVVDVWTPNAVFAPSPLWNGSLPGGCGTNPANKQWSWMSKDWGSCATGFDFGTTFICTATQQVTDGFNGAPMVDGPFNAQNANFNWMMPAGCVPADCNDNNPCTTDRCEGSTCVHDANTNPCDDGLFCTEGDTCANKACGAGPARNCADTLACTTDSCNETTNNCDHVVSTGCVIGNVCIAEGATDPANQCKACIGATSRTAYSNKPNATPCADANLCNGAETCQGGACTAGTAKNCNDNKTCTTDGCTPATGACTNVVNCTSPAVCNAAGDCAVPACAAPANGCEDNNVCTNNDWNTSFVGVTCPCLNTPVANGTACADANLCNGAETCQVGACTAGTAKDCNDNKACTTDGCTPATGACTNVVNCTGGQVCNAQGVCETPACSCPDDGNLCTDEVCENNVCTHPNNTAACTVNNAAGTCTAGVCIPTTICNGVKSVTIRGGGQNPSTVDLQIQTAFTVVGDGCIVNSSNSTIIITPGTVLQINCKAGIGPHATRGTWNGVPLAIDANDNVICPGPTGEEGKLILDNRHAAGGRDSDRMTIKVQ